MAAVLITAPIAQLHPMSPELPPPLQAQPGPTLHVLEHEMQLSPQAHEFVHTLQHAAGLRTPSSGWRGSPSKPLKEAIRNNLIVAMLIGGD
jgi:hypothetical protein